MILYDLKVDIDYRMVLSRLGIKDYGKPAEKKELKFEYIPKGIATKSARISFVPDKNFIKKLEKLTIEALTLMEPMAAYKFSRFEMHENRIELSDFGFSFESKNVGRILKNKQIVYLMACTLGSELEKYIEEVSQHSVSDAFILDAIGSETVEALANNVNQIIRRDAKTQGFPFLSMRFSPGYGDLNLDVQAKILEVLEADKIGIKLLPSGLMCPQKSITAIIGAGKDE